MGYRSLGMQMFLAVRSERQTACACCLLFGQELLDRAEHLLVARGTLPAKLAGPEGAHVAAAVEDINAGPHAVAPGVPVGFLVIDEDGKRQFFILELCLERFDTVLALSFGRVNTEERDFFAGELFLPLAIGGIVVDAVAAAEGKEMDDEDAAG